MDEFDRRVFTELIRAVVLKCFGHPLNSPLSEPESKHLSTEIEESTGLVIGWRSVKNYTAYVLNPESGKQENPSVATLDTLARYAFDAPVTSESERKKTEEHFPYWFRYREQAGLFTSPKAVAKESRGSVFWVITAGVFLTAAIGYFLFFRTPELEHIQENFRATDDSSLTGKGWFVQNKKQAFWDRRGERSGRLTLFTLEGDNWPKTGETPRIQNLLLREIRNTCFRAEVHLNDFIPSGNWQQAGLLLTEDTLFMGKSIRLSLSYNNYFGGFAKPGEVLIQAIASDGKGYANLEEFVHQPLFPLANVADRRIAITNLKNFAFRIEKQGQKFRFLYSASPVDNFSFKEVTTYPFGMTPKYIGVFALKGFVDTTATAPVNVRFFRLDGQRCE